ncbi:hypothetical protein VHUM_02625 [Vanrija humicola]|uniref:NADP-dependent oxidoreductase domain-containing protein n=1 Tax=Vanrija humicola TaxID=5417 RepID=A0A7D8V5E1_VANHU|nr:hypothetical protein VHUM_02625 [Vanrija humicola]
MPIPQVTLAGKEVGHIGLGLMQLTWTPTPPPEEQSFAAIKAAVDAGATAVSSATFYGPQEDQMANVAMLGRFFAKYPEYRSKIVLVLKGGVGAALKPDPSKDFNRECLRKAKELLGDYEIDVYLPARLLPGQDPIEYFRAFDELRQEGWFRQLGASEVSAPTLRKLSTAYDIAIAEIEVSLWSWEQDIQDVIAWSTETGKPVFAYSPLGRGFITRTWKTPEDVPEGSFQKLSPRFQGENFYHNLKLVDVLDELAAKKGITTAQLAIAWVASRGPNVIPIPGSSNVDRARANTESGNIKLTAEDEKEINDILAKFETKGGRYPDHGSSHLML